MNEEKVLFPENRIILLDGRELECYPKDGVTESIDNTLMLDSSGVFISVGAQSKTSDKKRSESKETSEKELFLKSAFLFYRNAERILSDSRMFLAPVPVQSGLAYTGTSGFRKPTLGVYIEWWKNCKADITHDNNEEEALTYHMAGSPLSGNNDCSCVYPDGRTESVVHRPFIPVWKSFMEINTRYDEAKSKYEAYSLEEVLELLLKTE